MEHLSELYLDGTAIKELPSSIGCASGLVVLDIKNCKMLRGFPTSILNLRSLQTLKLSGGLESENVIIRGIPSPISLFRNLGVLSFARSSLPSKSSHSIDFLLLSGLCSLQHLDLSHCNIPEGADIIKLGSLSSLKSLNLSGNNFISLPPNMLSRLSQLTRLDLHDCRSLKALLELPPSLISIDAHNCTSLGIIPDQSIYKCLYNASFINCFKLMKYQSSLETLFLTMAMDVTKTRFHVSVFSSLLFIISQLSTVT